MNVSVKINENGRILIPAEIRKQLGLVAGETMTLTVEGEELRLMTRRLEDELIAERREEARKELEDE